ncbi:MAG: aldo/keto reductase [Klebsiella pneumoniae]|nr:aldo/keto reductase [Klebsiella pneumoniae]
MTHPTVIKLHDGNLMPQLGLGVWKAGNEEVVSAIHKALEVGYRSPVPAIGHYVEAWQALIELQQQGLTKSIGVCNFQVPHLQKLIDETGVAPVINQIELHPLMQQRQLHAWNATHKIQTESWSPLAQGGEGVFDQKVIHQLADKYGKTPAQIVIRWHLDSGLVVIPKSVTPSRIAENFDVWDFRLDKDELGAIAKLDQGKRLGPDPDQFGG